MNQKCYYSWKIILLAAVLAASVISSRAASKVIAIFGDCGEGIKSVGVCGSSIFTNDAEQAAVYNLMNSWNPDALVTVGDNIYFRGNETKGTTNYSVFSASQAFDIAIGQYYHNYIKYPSGSASCFVGSQSSVNRYFPSVGNHDWNWDATADGGASTLAGYTGYFELPGANVPVGSVSSGNERYYDFIQGDAHFFMISSDPDREAYPTRDGITAPPENDGTTVPNTTSQKQAKWLKDALAASTAKWKFVVFHHPPYSSSGSIITSMRWPFRLWGADAVLDGHVHAYERIKHDSIPYITSGLGGRSRDGDIWPRPAEGMAWFRQEDGALKATIDDRTASFVFYTAGGREVDSVYLVKNNGGGTIDSRISASSDDMEEDQNGAFDNNPPSTDLELVVDGAAVNKTGMRFQSISVPRYAVIKKAYVQFVAKGTSSGALTLTVKGEAADNPGTFLTTPAGSKVSGRTPTTASVSWSPGNWGTDKLAGPDERTPDLSGIVQEIVNRSGWSSGNSMVILVTGTTGTRRAYSWDNTDHTLAPQLHIEWELPIVTVAATDSVAREPDNGTDTGLWTISRVGNTGVPLTVNYTVGSASTASSGDYNSIGTSVSFAATETTKTVTLTPINDSNYEGNETVVLVPSASSSYYNGTPDGATITIESIRDLGVLSGDSSSHGLALTYTGMAGGYSGDSSPRAFLTAANSAINSSTDNIDAELESWFGNGNGSVVNSAAHKDSGTAFWQVVGDWVDGSGNSRSFCRYRKPTGTGSSSDPTLSLTLLVMPYNGTATSVRSIRAHSWQSTYHGCVGYSIINGQPQVGYWSVDDISHNSWWYGYAWLLPDGASYGMDYVDALNANYTIGYWYGFYEDYSTYTTKAFIIDNASYGYFLSTPYPDLDSEAYSLNTSSQIVGFYMDSTVKRPALWQYSGSGSSSLTTLSMPSTHSSYHGRARSINASGQIVGAIFPSATPSETDHRACFWTSSSVIDLNDILPAGSDWLLYDGQFINDGGQITGYGLKGGAIHGFLMTP